MLGNIIKIAVRILIRNKFFSLINILGISIGITCALLIFTVVKHEMSFDRFHAKRDRLFVLEQLMDLGTGPYRTDRCGGACGPALKDAFPEIVDCIRYGFPIEVLMIYEQPDSAGIPRRKRFIENGVLPVDPNFLDQFSFPVLNGDAGTALDDPWSLVVTAESAKKYFGDMDPIGEVININSEYGFTVTAVVDNPPENSSIRFDFLVNFSFLDKLGYNLDNYGGNPFYTYLELEDPEKAADLEIPISEFLDEHQEDDFTVDQSLLPLKDFHLKGEQHGQVFTTILIILGIVILSIACINFMNLTTARYLSRTREVGVRKVTGARRVQLIRQFIGETMIIVFIALNLSILLVDIVLPAFNQNFELDIEFQLKDPVIIGGLLGVFLLTSFVSGSYPAFFLSSVKAVDVFSKFKGSRKRGGGIRRILVVVQFMFTIIFIIVTVVNYLQFNLMKESSMDFEGSNIVYFPVRGELYYHLPEFKQEVLLDPSIAHAASADYVPTSVDRGELEWGLTADETNELALVYPVGYDFDKIFGIEIVEGRFYSENIPGDTANGIVINRAVADALGYDDPVGSTFYFYEEPHIIIGVTRNYVFNPLSLSGDKVIYPYDAENSLFFVKTHSTEKEKVIDYIESVHEKYNPDYPLSMRHLDEYIDPITTIFGQLNMLIYFFTLFGILISCMGLLGLSIYSTEQRTKEIGIRKAMGANSQKILQLVTLDFLKLIFISLIIAIPVSILLIRGLLRLFAEKINLGPGIFLMAGLIVLIIAMATVSYQAIRSARSNPASSLRYE